MRKVIIAVLLIVAGLCLIAILALAVGVDLGRSPMLFARALVLSVALCVVALRAGRRK